MRQLTHYKQALNLVYMGSYQNFTTITKISPPPHIFFLNEILEGSPLSSSQLEAELVLMPKSNKDPTSRDA